MLNKLYKLYIHSYINIICSYTLCKLKFYVHDFKWGCSRETTEMASLGVVEGDFYLDNREIEQPAVLHAFSPSTKEAKVGGSLCSRPVWLTEQVTTEKP